MVRVEQGRHGRPRHAHNAHDVRAHEAVGREPGREEEEHAQGRAGVGGEKAAAAAAEEVRLWDGGRAGLGLGGGVWDEGGGGGWAAARAGGGEGEVSGGVFAEGEEGVGGAERRRHASRAVEREGGVDGYGGLLAEGWGLR